MIQKIITFTGRVQQAGFRQRLQDLARGLRITGFVENIIDTRERFPSEEKVKIFVQGRERAIDTFVEFGAVKNTLIDVQTVDVSDIDDDGVHFTDFYIHRDRVERELGDRLDVGIELLKKILSVQEETLEAMKSGHERIIQNSNENTDKIIDLTKSGFEGLKGHISKENEKWLGNQSR